MSIDQTLSNRPALPETRPPLLDTPRVVRLADAYSPAFVDSRLDRLLDALADDEARVTHDCNRGDGMYAVAA